MECPARKPNRLSSYDYSTPGAYFLTLCTKNKQCILGSVVGASIARPATVALSAMGKIVEKAILQIPAHYPAVTVDQYVVMPNHVHLLLQIHTGESGRPMVAPTVSRIMQQMKGAVTKQIGQSVWQKLYHDHVIRGEKDYLKIWQYIDSNPAKWQDDCFYVPDA